MTPQAGVGTGLGGLAAAGAGGSAIAYAAGAFNGNEPTYLSQALKAVSEQNKEYIGRNVNKKIESLLSEKTGTTPKYLDSLKGAWDRMVDDANPLLGKPGGNTSDLFQETKLESKKGEISTYTSKWCEHTAKKTLIEIPKAAGDGKNIWDAFNEACFWKKATVSG
ncbi:hypothetical protein [Candidatus Mycoplasma haematohominis]|uniref:Uncharacterized protein n=1 Tax=Candidatus Mycoplasma haematohominis TaxID=1494318 RepID=A0A478FPE4_9MOLU|nr:hypothetical protein [Candidatus Mycoplasma haemohominis]GCE63082.1 hypothetical protein MHSWG343_00600 [Candidatus Mycoplasma haemohominis]